MKFNELLRKELQRAYDDGFTYIFKCIFKSPLTLFKGYCVTNKKASHTGSVIEKKKPSLDFMIKVLPDNIVINAQLDKLIKIKSNINLDEPGFVSDPVSIKSLLGKQFIPITKEWVEINKQANEEKEWTERKIIIF